MSSNTDLNPFSFYKALNLVLYYHLLDVGPLFAAHWTADTIIAFSAPHVISQLSME